MQLAIEYDNRARVPEHPEIIARWKRDAEAFRASAKTDLDLAYGARPRNRFDLFHGSSAGPVVVFIHGGYWRTFDKSVFSHMAAGVYGHGFSVAMPSYSLCPDVTIPGIVDELRQFCLHLWKDHGRRLVIAGHSAGGHLAACMAATNWKNYGAPADLIQAGLSISGVFDLRPLMATPMNEDLRLTQADAIAASPLFWPVPRILPFDIWVGAAESSEFLRQSASLAAAWTGLGLSCALVELSKANHFTAADPLADPRSTMVARLAQLASG